MPPATTAISVDPAVAAESIAVSAEDGDEQEQPVFQLPAEDKGELRKGMSKKCLGYRIEWL
jgi:hypothetical protein